MSGGRRGGGGCKQTDATLVIQRIRFILISYSTESQSHTLFSAHSSIGGKTPAVKTLHTTKINNKVQPSFTALCLQLRAHSSARAPKNSR